MMTITTTTTTSTSPRHNPEIIMEYSLWVRYNDYSTAARQPGIIQADLAVALSMSITHKNIFFDKKMPDVKFD
jgi:hypothetical protein